MWKKLIVTIAVLAGVAGGLISQADAYLKSCKLIPGTHPGAEGVTGHNLYRVEAVSASSSDVAAADQALASAHPILVAVGTPPEARSLGAYGMDVAGKLYRVQIAAVNANGEGPRSDIQSVPIDATTGGGTTGPVPSKAAFSIQCN
jgi:hypothetical protein